MQGPYLWMSIGGGVSLTIAIMATVVLLLFKKRKQDYNEARIIEMKESLSYNKVPIKMQLGLGKSTGGCYQGKMPEAASDNAQPLLGVLHTSSLNRERFKRHKFTNEEKKRRRDSSRRKTKVEEEQTKEINLEDGISANIAVVWASNDCSLSVVILDVDVTSSSSHHFVLVRLESSKMVFEDELKFEDKKEFIPNSSLTFSFRPLSLEDVHKCYLILLFSEKNSRFLKETVLARGFFSFSKVVIIPNKPLPAEVRLNYLQDKTHSDSSSADLGSLDIGIKCCFVGQISAKFIVKIGKAEKLHGTKTRGEFKVEFFVLRNGDRLYWFSTGLRGGSNPEWNSSFSFNISRTNFSEYSLEFMVIRVGHLTGFTRVGKTTLHNVSLRSNVVYWEHAIENMGEEIEFKRILKSAQIVPHSPDDKMSYMGLILVSLEQKSIVTDNNRKAKFEMMIKTLAHFEYCKNGGDYKVEVLLKRKEVTMETLTSLTAPSTHVTWNARFPFQISHDEMDFWTILVTLVRIGRMKKAIRIGTLSIDASYLRKCQDTPRVSIETWHPIYKL